MDINSLNECYGLSKDGMIDAGSLSYYRRFVWKVFLGRLQKEDTREMRECYRRFGWRIVRVQMLVIKETK